jgi:hypothetical protein
LYLGVPIQFRVNRQSPITTSPRNAIMLRHACGFALANKGHDTRALQAYLGHKNIQHTVRYWDTAWSVIISGIMFATVVVHPDAEVRAIVNSWSIPLQAAPNPLWKSGCVLPPLCGVSSWRSCCTLSRARQGGLHRSASSPHRPA